MIVLGFGLGFYQEKGAQDQAGRNSFDPDALIARLERTTGTLDQALAAAERALALRPEGRDKREHSGALNEVGNVQRAQGDLGAALTA